MIKPVKEKRRGPGTWYVMATGDGRYLGTIWAANGSGGWHKPRLGLVPSLNSKIPEVINLCFEKEECRLAATRAREVLGVATFPVEVEFIGKGEDTKIRQKREFLAR
jgi:hypothetical protein